MLDAAKIIGFVPTTNYDAARSFYEGILGLRFVKNDGFAMVLDANGNMVRVSKVQDFKPLPYTILGWEVASVDEAVATLTARGVTFEHVWTAPTGDKVAWFKDPDGNTLSVSQHV